MVSGLFEKVIFTRVSEDDIVKASMNGFDDPSLRNYTLMPLSALFKKDLKREGLEKEYIASFLTGAKELARIDNARRSQFGAVQVFYNNSLAMVVFYLSRHCVELSIKRAIKKIGGIPKPKHNLESLWNFFVAYANEMKTKEDRQTLGDMQGFVKVMNSYDENGTILRYSETPDGTPAHDDPYFLNTARLVEVTGNFVEQLEQISPVTSQKSNQ